MNYKYAIMEEKKKRWRPTLKEYMAQKAELEEQIEGTSRIVQDCYAWRKKYRELFGRVTMLESRGFWSRLFNKKV